MAPRWQRAFLHKLHRKNVSVKLGAGPKPSFEAGTPEPLFDPHIVNTVITNLLHQYDVTDNGQRFIVVTANKTESPLLNLVVNWNAESRK